MSESLLMGRAWAIVPEMEGKERGRRLKPWAIAMSSIISAWWRTSARVGGIRMSRVSGSDGEGDDLWDMRVRRAHASLGERERPQQAFM